MERIRPTTWGWYFIPLFTSFFKIPGWLLGISEPSTVSTPMSPFIPSCTLAPAAVCAKALKASAWLKHPFSPPEN